MPQDAADEHTGDDEIESIAQSFVLKIWLEERGQRAVSAIWRGYITHVASGERRYIKNLDGIASFIAPYLQRMGVQLSRGQRLKQWLRRQRWRLL